MSLDLVIFGSLSKNDGYPVQYPALPWGATASLTVGGTANQKLKAGQVVQIIANGSAHTFNCGDSGNSQVIASGGLRIYTVQTDCVLTVTA